MVIRSKKLSILRVKALPSTVGQDDNDDNDTDDDHDDHDDDDDDDEDDTNDDDDEDAPNDDDDEDACYRWGLYLNCNLGQVTHLLSTSFFASSPFNLNLFNV